MVVLKTSVEILIFLKKFFEILREIGEGTEFTFFKLHKWFTYQKKPWGLYNSSIWRKKIGKIENLAYRVSPKTCSEKMPIL